METRATSRAVDFAMPSDNGTLTVLRRKLAFRAWHRGTCEADLMLGGFADRYLTNLAAEELGQFERLLEEDDPEIVGWMSGRQTIPSEHDNRVMALLRRFSLAVSASLPLGSDEPWASRPKSSAKGTSIARLATQRW
jgi:antitoxin CptB